MAVDVWLKVHQAGANTLRCHESNARRYIKPALGRTPVGGITAQCFEEFHAEPHRCSGKPMVEHRVEGDHECRLVRHRYPAGRPTVPDRHDCKKMRCPVIECQPHTCKPLAASTIRDIHFTISAAFADAVRWGWITSNPADVARKPRKPAPEPKPPTPADAARIVEAAGRGLGQVRVAHDGHRHAPGRTARPAVASRCTRPRGARNSPQYVRENGRALDKDTKTHRMRRIALDPDTVELLAAHPQRYEDAVRSVGVEPSADAFLFSHRVMHDRPYSPDWVSHRYAKMCAKLGIDSHLHAMRHYGATELLTAGVDLRTVAGRLGHAGGGATTLRVYAAWVNASDQQAAKILGGRVQRPDRLA